MHINTKARSLKDCKSIIRGSHNDSLMADEIIINYIENREPYDCKAKIVNIHFSKQIVEIIQSDLDPNLSYNLVFKKESVFSCVANTSWSPSY
jgi:hypothetical protein